MACKGATAGRVSWALGELMAGRGSSAVVSDLSQREGVSRRQAQRLVGKAYEVLQSDLDLVERKDLAAQLVHLLMTAAEQALKAKNSGAVVGVSRELRALLGLGSGSAPTHTHFGRFGS